MLFIYFRRFADAAADYFMSCHAPLIIASFLRRLLLLLPYG